MIVGIDLGTTNSAIAIWRDGQAQLIPNSLGELLTPSAVKADAEAFLGEAVRRQPLGRRGLQRGRHELTTKRGSKVV
jgi:molecular chaperone HscC